MCVCVCVCVCVYGKLLLTILWTPRHVQLVTDELVINLRAGGWCECGHVTNM